MEINETSLNQFAACLQQTLNADARARREAESQLQSTEGQRNYAKLLLHLVDSQNIDITIRVAGAIAFKNYIKRNWAPQEEENSVDKIHADDRVAIKALIVPLMLKSPSSIQKQLSDAISIIGKHDFPQNWPQLLDEMVERFATGDYHVINGVLQTAHSLFKRYRYEYKSQKLWEEIKLVLTRMAEPLTTLLTATMRLAKEHQNNVEALRVIYSSLLLINKVFLSLNSQDLPEYFEDNMATWMSVFCEQLSTDVPLLNTDGDEEIGVLEHLRAIVCENISMYARKYDEEFTPFVGTFATKVFELLIKTVQSPKYDTLVSNALQFLSIIAERDQNKNLFESAETLAAICEKIVIPNLDLRTSDEELFEDSPEEYIRRDIEGSDVETRRRAACDLVKVLSKNFGTRIFNIFSEYLNILITKYYENTTANWRAKDTAIYLVTTMASRGGTQKHGITQTSELVPLAEFYARQIIPELQSPNVNELPVLKADAIKYVVVFRSILGKDILINCMPLLIRHLASRSAVVHSYAASAIEKILALNEGNNTKNPPVLTAEILTPMANDLITGLFTVLALPGSEENEYAMKAIMRSFHTLNAATLTHMDKVLPFLTEKLNAVSKNPSRPNFNHYLFETLSLSVKIVCQVHPEAISTFEEVLFPVFQLILQQDIAEFLPYIFQMLSLFLEIRENISPIPEPYWAIFPCLLAPVLWERPSNVSPLIRFINAFIKRGSAEIQKLDKLVALLGIFQKMIASRINDHEGFNLLQKLLTYYPIDQIQPHIGLIFTLLFQRLSNPRYKTPKFLRGVTVFLCFYVAKFGGDGLIRIINGIQNNMISMVVANIFCAEIPKLDDEKDQKIVIIGITRLLTECQEIFNNQPKVCISIFECIVNMLAQPTQRKNKAETDILIGDADNEGQQGVGFSQLTYAKPPADEYFPEISQRRYFTESWHRIAKTDPGRFQAIIGAIDPTFKKMFENLCAQESIYSF